jgi:hypothetical protein
MTYAEAVVADSPIAYWQMGETSGLTFEATVGATPITLGTLTAKPTMGVAGATTALGKAAQFDGTNDFASVAIDLSARATIAIEFWLYWDAFANNDDMALEFTADGGGTAGGFYIDPNSSTTHFAVASGSAANIGRVPRPSAAAWHHYALTINRAVTVGNTDLTSLVIDGVAQTITTISAVDNAGNFANSTLYLMSRAGGGLFGAGRMQHLAIYPALTAGQAQAHYALRNSTDEINPATLALPPGRSPGVRLYDSSRLRGRRR